MEKLGKISKKWWFISIIILCQFLVMPFASRNFSFDKIGDIIFTTLSNALQTRLIAYNPLIQAFSLVMLLLLVLLRNRFKRIFEIYVAVSYIAFTFIQNIAITETYGVSVISINVLMFLFVSVVWVNELFKGGNDYSFSNFKWRYLWMIIFSLFAYLLPYSINGSGALDLNPLNFFYKSSASAFCLTTPLFLTLLTLNIPKVNIVTYRITAIFGFIIGIYNMGSFFNPHTVYLGLLHIPLLTISLYCWILSYRVEKMQEC